MLSLPGLPTDTAVEPLSRRLVFPDPELGSYPPRPGYEALFEGGHDLSMYTILAPSRPRTI